MLDPEAVENRLSLLMEELGPIITIVYVPRVATIIQ
jgi:hypothetical protein